MILLLRKAGRLIGLVEAVTTAPVKRCGLRRGGSAALGSPENQRLQKQSGVATSNDNAEEQDEKFYVNAAGHSSRLEWDRSDRSV
jgi:hypothetical protein